MCKAYKYESHFFKQKVDHFGYTNDDYFLQRYLINLEFYSPQNGSVFFYTGNEGDIVMFANNTGFMWENAAKFNAALVFAEHRYYGLSLPYGNLSYSDKKYLGYLTSEQALADFATLISFLKTQLPGAAKAPVIAFGGSYGGMLAAWIRIKYPHLFNGAIASSAPVLQFEGLTSCEKFSEIVTEDFKNSSYECSKSIRKSWDIIRRFSKTESGLKFLTETFHLCPSVSFNVNDLIDWLSGTWSFLAMTNYPYPTNFLLPLPAYPIRETCKQLLNSSVSEKDIIMNIYKAVSVFQNSTGEVKCFNLTQSGGPSLGQEGWNYQACTEMVQPMCQTGTSDMFEPLKWNFTLYSKSCFEKYGVKPELYKAVIMYGGRNINSSSNIIFTNGLLDPWYGGGVLKSLSDTLIAILIEDAAHHLDLRSSNPADPLSVLKARKTILNWISHWTSEVHSSVL